MNVLVLDGHPDEGRLVSHLLDCYVAALPPGTSVDRIAVRELSFDPNLKAGYARDQPWEPDLQRVGEAIALCDHLVIGFPLWWGGEPAMLKGLMDRVLLPGFAFSYRRGNTFWDRLLKGRSADVIAVMDTPPWYLRLVYGDAVMRRWRRQILGFCGIAPVRLLRFGPTRRGAAKKNIEAWNKRLRRAASTAADLKRGQRSVVDLDERGSLQNTLRS